MDQQRLKFHLWNNVDLAVIMGCVAFFVGVGPAYPRDDGREGPSGGPASPIISGQPVAGSNPSLMAVNRAVVGLDGVKSGGGGSLGTGILVGPRLVLTASHVGQDGTCGSAGQSVEFGVDSAQFSERVAVLGEIDFEGSCSLLKTPNCCSPDGNNVDVGLWVLEHPPAVAAPYWNRRPDIEKNEFVRFYGYGPNDDPGQLWEAGCIVQTTYSDPFDGARFNSGGCANGAIGEGGDSGGPVLDVNNQLVGVHIGTGTNTPSIAMRLAIGYITWVEHYRDLFEAELKVGDFNGDGLGDFLHWNRNDRGNWLDLNAGSWPDGGGEPGSGFTWCAQELHVGDFNGDGSDDVLCHHPAGQKLYYRFGSATGALTAAASYTSSWCDHELYVGDFNGDGYDDLLCREQNEVRRIKINAQGSNPFPGNESNWQENHDWCGQELHIGRFDGDSRDDVLCRNPELALYVRHGTPTGGLGPTTSLATPWCGQKLLVGDFNGDARDDLMCLDQGGDSVWIDFASTAAFPFSGQTDWGNLSYPFCDQSPDVADVDGDGTAELLCHDAESGIVWMDRTATTFNGFDGAPDAKCPNVATPLWP